MVDPDAAMRLRPIRTVSAVRVRVPQLRRTMPPRDGAAMPRDLLGAERRAVVLRRSIVAAALYDLPRYQREALALQYYGNLSEDETAAALHISRGAVHSHTAHGLSALRAALQTGISSPGGLGRAGTDRGARAGP